jgi:hypothetical protein
MPVKMVDNRHWKALLAECRFGGAGIRSSRNILASVRSGKLAAFTSCQPTNAHAGDVD